MYALGNALPFHLRAGAAVYCSCSFLYGENNIDDTKTLFFEIADLILSS
jgi:hypothetical protein